MHTWAEENKRGSPHGTRMEPEISSFRIPLARGHESFFLEENILHALFADALPRLAEELMFSSEEYESVGGGYRPTGRRKRTWNGIELRRRAEIENLFGRYGTIRGWPVLMCWNWPDRMSELLNRVVEKLTVPHDAILTCGETEMGLIRDYLTIEAS